MTEPAREGPKATTPLHDRHEALGARFTEFSGFDMPLQFDGILQEHEAVRTEAGIFDVSHMSNLIVPGDQGRALSHAIGKDVTQLTSGKAAYTVCLRGDGTILDDLIVFHVGEAFHVVPNAGMNETIGDYLEKAGCTVEDLTRETCILAVQGPEARTTIEKLYGEDHLAGRFQLRELPGEAGFVAGTGYTGEPGVEFFVPIETAQDLWDELVEAGVQPCGLGARDTLRLEMGYCLAGNEFDPPVSPVEAGLMWAIDLGHSFTGREKVASRQAAGPEVTLTGLRVTERGIPRRGCKVLADGEPVGRVSSGTMSPTLGTGIALAYVTPDQAEPGSKVSVEVRGRPLAAEVTKPPFVET